MATYGCEVDVVHVTDQRQTEADLYRAHRAELIRFATALVGTSDAPDVVSEAVLSLLKSGRLLEADRPAALLYRAVSAKATSLHRSRFRRRAREQRFAEPLIAHDASLRPEVFQAVAGLSVQQRACVFLAYWEDLTAEAVADRLGIGVGTVKRYLARARERLREVLDD